MIYIYGGVYLLANQYWWLIFFGDAVLRSRSRFLSYWSRIKPVFRIRIQEPSGSGFEESVSRGLKRSKTLNQYKIIVLLTTLYDIQYSILTIFQSPSFDDKIV